MCKTSFGWWSIPGKYVLIKWKKIQFMCHKSVLYYVDLILTGCDQGSEAGCNVTSWRDANLSMLNLTNLVSWEIMLSSASHRLLTWIIRMLLWPWLQSHYEGTLLETSPYYDDPESKSGFFSAQRPNNVDIKCHFQCKLCDSVDAKHSVGTTWIWYQLV